MHPAVKPVLSVDISGLSRGGSPILGPVAFSIKRGEAVALTGPSGIGKTSLLRAIAGLGGDVTGTIDAPRKIAYVFQEPTLLPWRKARANIMLATGADADAAQAALAWVGLGDRADAFPEQLSLGQQRRLSLARAFAARPDLLILDEPFVSLDANLVGDMITLVAQFLETLDCAILLVTHSSTEARRLADRRLALAGSPATLVQGDQDDPKHV